MPVLQVDWETLVSVNLPTLLLVIVAVPLALVGYIVGADVLVRRLPKRSQASVRPWVWVGPAILFVGVILVYPMVGTIVRSLFDRHGSTLDRKSTRLNSSHTVSSYAVFCLKKQKKSNAGA